MERVSTLSIINDAIVLTVTLDCGSRFHCLGALNIWRDERLHVPYTPSHLTPKQPRPLQLESRVFLLLCHRRRDTTARLATLSVSL